jgi:ribonuclease Z
MAEFALTIIGSGSALPMHGRNPSAQVLQYDHIFCLIDCGEGTQMKLKDAGVKLFRIEVIVISHLHGDHFFGLPGLLSTLSHLGRKEKLHLFGPPGLQNLIEAIKHYTQLHITFPIQIEELEPTGLQSIWTSGNLEILTFPLHHRVPCNGYLFREKKAIIKLKKEAVETHKLTTRHIKDLLEGKDIEVEGRQFSNDTLTHGIPQILSYAYCSDTSYNEGIVPFIRNVTLLYHEATFKNELKAMADKTGHSTAGEAGQIARSAGVKCLLTGHYSSRYKDATDLVEEARQFFPNSLLSVEGKKYNLHKLASDPTDASG